MRIRKTIAGVAGGGLLALALTGCGTSGSDSDEPGAGHGKGTGKPAKAQALPVESTARKATWTAQSTAHQLRIAPKRLARGTAADLEHVRLGEDLKGMVPYYLTVSYTNTGTAALRRPDPQTRFTVTLADGTPGEAISLWNSNPLATQSSSALPDNCDRAGPASVAAGATATVCQLVMLPEGHRPATVAYADDTGGTLLWKVGDGRGDDNGGTLLPAGATADSSWKDVTTEGDAVPLRVTPKSVRAGKLADLSGYDLGDAQKNTVPWYVTLEYRNTGEEELLPVMDEGVGVRSAGGREVRPLSLLDLSFSRTGEGKGIDQCRGGAPRTRLQPGSRLTLCTVHLLPRGDRPAMVSFEGEGEGEGRGAEPLMWRAGAG